MEDRYNTGSGADRSRLPIIYIYESGQPGKYHDPLQRLLLLVVFITLFRLYTGSASKRSNSLHYSCLKEIGAKQTTFCVHVMGQIQAVILLIQSFNIFILEHILLIKAAFISFKLNQFNVVHLDLLLFLMWSCQYHHQWGFWGQRVLGRLAIRRRRSWRKTDMSVFMVHMVSVHGPHGQCSWSTWSVFIIT